MVLLTLVACPCVHLQVTWSLDSPFCPFINCLMPLKIDKKKFTSGLCSSRLLLWKHYMVCDLWAMFITPQYQGGLPLPPPLLGCTCKKALVWCGHSHSDRCVASFPASSPAFCCIYILCKELAMFPGHSQRQYLIV